MCVLVGNFGEAVESGLELLVPEPERGEVHLVVNALLLHSSPVSQMMLVVLVELACCKLVFPDVVVLRVRYCSVDVFDHPVRLDSSLDGCLCECIWAEVGSVGELDCLGCCKQ